MRSLEGLELATEYRTGESNLIQDFYIPCLSRAAIYQRAVGYFRSSVMHVGGPAFVEFARRGGKIFLVCSPELSDQDIDAIERGYTARGDMVARAIEEDIDKLLSDGQCALGTRILATLIASGAMDLRIAVRKTGHGIFHEKIGIFRDELGNLVSFKGSSNESLMGWHASGNFESNEVFCSWRGGTDRERAERHAEYFLQLWQARIPELTVLPFPEAARQKLLRSAARSLDEVDGDLTTGTTPRRTPMRHQVDALAAWRQQGGRGILEHATGSGKTFTALIAIEEHLRRSLPVLVLVPSRLLLEQWNAEIRAEFPDSKVLLAGAGYEGHQQPYALSAFTDESPEFGKRVVVAMMQTARDPNFRSQLHTGEHLMVVADEVHQIGSQENSKCLQIDSGLRLGLSATPNRFGDPEGTKRIFDYFGPVVPPPFSLVDAIKAGRLVPYQYFPRRVYLSDEEIHRWAALTKKVIFALGASGKGEGEASSFSDARVKHLLIQRARIMKKAEGKVPLAREVLKSQYEDGQTWLVYCEDSEQLRSVVESLQEIGLNPLEYHTAMEGASRETLEYFRRNGGVLAAIACLDEGVDIPRISHALILASSQNPRQFIQRRGRVLRANAGKNRAFLHDALALPPPGEIERVGLRMLQTELRRAWEFASTAENSSAALEVEAIASDYGLDLSELLDVGYEEDNE